MTNSGNEFTNTIPLLSEGYNKAHRAYMVVSALLLAWELVGITVEKQPLKNYNISLKSPEAFPLILVVLVLYFMFKITVEWHLIDENKRASVPAGIDFYSAQTIGVVSLVLYAYQQASKIQIVNILPESSMVNLLVSFFIIIAIYTSMYVGRRLIVMYLKYKSHHDRFYDNEPIMRIMIWNILTLTTVLAAGMGAIVFKSGFAMLIYFIVIFFIVMAVIYIVEKKRFSRFSKEYD